MFPDRLFGGLMRSALLVTLTLLAPYPPAQVYGATIIIDFSNMQVFQEVGETFASQGVHFSAGDFFIHPKCFAELGCTPPTFSPLTNFAEIDSTSATITFDQPQKEVSFALQHTNTATATVTAAGSLNQSQEFTVPGSFFSPSITFALEGGISSLSFGGLLPTAVDVGPLTLTPITTVPSPEPEPLALVLVSLLSVAVGTSSKRW